MIVNSFFSHYEGRQECGVSSTDLYVPPRVTKGDHDHALKHAYCHNRATLLEAMNGGGRHGFDTPFTPKGTICLGCYTVGLTHVCRLSLPLVHD
jgi:hypothetical protein